MSIVNDADAIDEARRRLRCQSGTHDLNLLGWCKHCSYSPPGWKKTIWFDFNTGEPVNSNPWERRR